jgi:hypothetical protein
MISETNQETPALLAQDIFWRLVSSPSFTLSEQSIAQALRQAFTCAQAFFDALALEKQKPHPERDLLALTKELEKALSALPEDKRKEALSGLGTAIVQAQAKGKGGKNSKKAN